MNRSIDASDTLRRVLADRGLTQEEFARANDMGIATANRWINGKVLVSERKLSRALATIGADPRDYGLSVAPTVPGSDEAAPAWIMEMEARLEERARVRHDEVMKALGDVLNAVRARR